MKYSKNWQQPQALTFQSQLYQFLHQNRFTRKTVSRVALQRSEVERVQYKSDISANNQVFVDETGTGRRNALWRFGYSLCGKPARALNLFVRGQHVTAIGTIWSEGVYRLQNCTQKFNCGHLSRICQPTAAAKASSIQTQKCYCAWQCSYSPCWHCSEVLWRIGCIGSFLTSIQPRFNAHGRMLCKVEVLN